MPGALPWLLATIAVLVALYSRGTPRAIAEHQGGTAATRADGHGSLIFGALLVVVGLALSIGNNNPLAPGTYFGNFPLLGGVRAFSRYQILIVFGLAILAARGVAELGLMFESRGSRDRDRRCEARRTGDAPVCESTDQ